MLPSERCPGCGAFAAHTVTGDQLANSDAQWVWKIGHGAWIVGLAMILQMLMPIIELMVKPIGQHQKFRLMSAAEALPGVAIGWAVTAGLLALGALLITSRQPIRTRRLLPGWPSRVLTRVCLIGVATAGMGCLVIERWRLEENVPVLLAFLGLYVVGVIALIMHYSNLAKRVPAPKMAVQAHVILWLVVAVVVLSLVPWAIMLAGGDSNPATGFAGLALMGLGCMFWGLCIWWVILLMLLATAVFRAARDASRWQKASLPPH